MAPSRAPLIERTSGGAPHGVYHASRPGASSNGDCWMKRPSSSRSKWARAVPTRSPADVMATQLARRLGVFATNAHRRPSSLFHSSRPSTRAHRASALRPSATTSRPASSSTGEISSAPPTNNPSSVATSIIGSPCALITQDLLRSAYRRGRAAATARRSRRARAYARRMDGGAARMRTPRGALLAIASAALFGASTPLAKALLRDVDSLMLAGLLYLGSGAGLVALQAMRRLGRRAAGEARLAGHQWLWLALAIAVGGVAAPALLMYGLSGATASATALLLNLESIFTAVLAWLVFREAADRRIVLGMGAIALGAIVLSWQGPDAAGRPLAVLAIAGACLGWAIDNNLTRKVALTDPVQIAALK